MISGHIWKRLLIRCDLVHLIIYQNPDLNRLLNTVRNALEKNNSWLRIRFCQQELRDDGDSEAIDHIKVMIDKVAQTDARVHNGAKRNW
jgi:DNA-binding NtrC family response regulator